jgi:hypothetical protein
MEREELMAKLHDYLVKNPMDQRRLALEMGVAISTLRTFFKGQKCNSKTLYIVENYLYRMEQRDK